MTTERRNAPRDGAAAAMFALLAMGCGNEASEREAALSLEQEPAGDVIDASLEEAGGEEAGLSAADGGHDAADAGSRRDPGGSYFADVTANGTGCPAGTWDAQLSPDGQTFRLTFSMFEAEVDPKTAVSIKNCQLSIKLHSPQGMSYAVQDFYQAGYVYLEEGVEALFLSNYYFQGNPSRNQQPETTFVGPKDDTYLIQDTRLQVDSGPDWSPCGVDRNLNINSTIRLRNTSNPRRNGFVNVEEVFGLKLAWRRCSQ